MTLVEILCIGIMSIPGLGKSTAENACKRYVPIVETTSAKYGVDPSLMLSIMYVESSYRRRVVSSAGACGLMQIIPKYTNVYRRRNRGPYTCDQLKRPNLNIKLGIRIYSRLLKMANQDEDRALCYYNAGPRGCEKIYKRGTAAATKKAISNSKYVKKVRKIQKHILSIQLKK